MYSTILVKKQDDFIAKIILNCPENLNAMNQVMKDELIAAFNSLNMDESVKVIIISGQGKSFCAGGDISSMGNYAPGGGRMRMLKSHPLYDSIINSDKITIAAISGYAVGAGLSLACCCDFRVIADNTKFIASFINMALVPDGGLMYTLPRIIGTAKTLELFLSAEPLSASDIMSYGLASRVTTVSELDQSALVFAQKFITKNALTVALIKNILNKSLESSLATILSEEATAQDICMQTTEHKQAVLNFLRKSK